MGFFFFKQKTAYEMRISDWSSDVCSSDLLRPAAGRGGSGQHARRRLHGRDHPRAPPHRRPGVLIMAKPQQPELRRSGFVPALDPDATESRLSRKSAGEGKSGSISVDLGGRGIIHTKTIRFNEQ